jgi:hypothetical protein
MPEEVPKFNPNKPYKDVSSGTYKEASSSSAPPPFDPNKPYRSAPREAFQEEGFVPEKYVSGGGYEDMESTLDFIQKNSKRIMRDDEKDILRDMFRNPNATKEDISDAIVTLQGKKAKQIDNTITMPDYYMDINEKGVYKPIALTQGERPPKGKEIISLWGTQKSADDDAWYTDVAKTAFNIIPGVVGGVVDVAQLGTQLVAGEESEWLKEAQLGTEALKFKKDVDISKSIYNTEDINKFTDLFDSKRIDYSPETLWGTALSAAGFMGEMLVPASIISKGAKGYKAGKAGLSLIEEAGDISKVAKKASVFAGSFMTQVGDVMESSSDAGLEGRSKAVYDLAIGSALALVDAKYDVAGKILSNKLAQGAKKEILSEVGKKVVKDEFGNITKESLNQATKEAMTAYTPVVSGFVKNFGKDVLDEVKDEVLQSFIEKSGQNIYDKLSFQEKANFGTDAFSAKSFGEYINSAVSGLVGAGAPSLMSAKGKQQVDYKAQSNNAYETVMQGEEAVKAFKTNITNAFQAGQINKEDYDNAILKVDSYDSYEKVSKDLTLDNENKKKLFELSLQKENLKAAIKDAESKDTEGHSRLDKMNPAELGLHNSKMKQAKALQDEIDLIVSKSEVLQQPEVAEKVVEKVVKAEEKAAEGTKVKEGVSSEIGAILGRQYKVKTPVGGEVAVPGKAAYEVPKKVLEETRKMKEIPVEEFNDPNFDVTVKQAKLAEALDEVPEKTTTGTLQIDNEFTDDKGRKVQTFNVTLPNGKAARFASSMVRFPEEEAMGGYRGFTYEENLTNRENPVGQKLGVTVRTLKDSGRKVIFVWNADEGPKFGKHVGMVKERLRGKSEYGAADLDEMADLRMINMGQNPNAPAPGIITPKEPTKGGAPKAKAAPVKNKEVRDKLKGLGYSKPEIQAMEPQEANDIVKEQREKSKVKKQPLEEVEIKDKKAAAKVEKKIADLRAQEQEQLKREIPNIDKYKVDGKVDENLIKDTEDLKKYKEIYDKYDEKISPLLGKEPAKEKGKAVVKKAPKEVVVEKQESIAKREALMESIRGASKLVAAYNGLTKAQKKSKIGVDLYKKIQDRVKEIGYTTTISRGGTLQLMGEKGKRVYKTPVKRTEDQKAMDEERKDALSAEATSIRHAVILSIANGRQFDVPSLEKYFPESVLKNEMPSLLKNNKNGIKVSSYKTSYEERFGQFEIENLTEADATREAAEALGDYFIDGFREAAIQDAIDINFKTKNEGRSRGEVEALNEMQREQDREEKELEEYRKEAEVILTEEELTKEEYRKQAEQEEFGEKEAKPSEPVKLDLNVESTTNGLEEFINEDSSINKIEELKLVKKLPEKTKNSFIIDGDILRIKLPTKDFNNRPDGATYITLKVPENFNQEKFKEELVDIKHPGGRTTADGKSTAKVVEDVRQALQNSITKKPLGGERLQKAKVKPATLNKFEKSVDLFYKTKDADGASKKRSLAAERREFLEKNPTVKYIDDNMKYIYKQLEDQNIIERKGECP